MYTVGWSTFKNIHLISCGLNKVWSCDQKANFCYCESKIVGSRGFSVWSFIHRSNWYTLAWPLARYVELRVAHAPGMPGRFFPPPWVCDPTCITHVPWCLPGSLTNGFLWSLWRGERSRHSRSMRNPLFYVSGKRPIRVRFGKLSINGLKTVGSTGFTKSSKIL